MNNRFFNLFAALALGSVVAQASALPASELTLPQAVEYGLAHSPLLEAARAETRLQQGAVKTARSGLLPRVDLFADATQSRFARGFPPGTPPRDVRFDHTLYQGGARFNLLAWDFHRTEWELEAARSVLQASLSSVERRRQEVIFSVARLYLQSMTFDDLIAAARARRKSLRTLAEQTHELVSAGRAVPAQELKVRAQLARVESDLASLDAGRTASLSELAATMGWEGPQLALVETAPAVAPVPVPPPPIDLQAALAERPDMKAARDSVAAARLAWQAAHRSLWPRISLHAAVVEYGSNTPDSFPTLIGRVLPGLPTPLSPAGQAVADWNLGATFELPLFDGGRRRGVIAQAQARLELAEQQMRRLQLSVAQEVETARARLQSASSRVQSLLQAVEQSRAVLRNERLKYEAGRTAINFVLDAEAVLLENESLLSQARRFETIARLALDLSQGRLKKP